VLELVLFVVFLIIAKHGMDNIKIVHGVVCRKRGAVFCGPLLSLTSNRRARFISIHVIFVLTGCARLILCSLETFTIMHPRPDLACCATEKRLCSSSSTACINRGVVRLLTPGDNFNKSKSLMEFPFIWLNNINVVECKKSNYLTKIIKFVSHLATVWITSRNRSNARPLAMLLGLP
jgi:hypothetical protein